MRRIEFLRRGLMVASGFLMTGVGSHHAASQSKENSPIRPDSPQVVAGEAEAKKLLLLMDTDKSGKVSRDEFMRFMAAEFDRLDVNKDGELDVKELEKSQLMPARRGGIHR